MAPGRQKGSTVVAQDGWIRARKDQRCGVCYQPVPKGEMYWGDHSSKWKRKCKTCAGVPPTTGLAHRSTAERP